MAKVILGMSLSLDGFISDKYSSLGKLYPDFDTKEFKDYINETIPETGAVLMGRKTFDMAGDPDSYAVDYEYQVPLFILTSNPPEKHPKENENLTITFLDKDIKEAVEIAKKAAGDKDLVIVGGADVAQQMINANVFDELQIDLIPIILGSGTRFFENINSEIKLKRIETKEIGQRTTLRFKVEPV